eukprot:SAG11_NODE_4163_length_2030_cov_1.321595_2_plen_110_part_00
MLKIVFLMLALAHYSACYWHFIGDTEEPLTDPDEMLAEPSWVYDVLSHNASLATRYATSIYWAVSTLSTVGCTEFGPTNAGEQVFAVLVEVRLLCHPAATEGGGSDGHN